MLEEWSSHNTLIMSVTTEDELESVGGYDSTNSARVFKVFDRKFWTNYLFSKKTRLPGSAKIWARLPGEKIVKFCKKGTRLPGGPDYLVAAQSGPDYLGAAKSGPDYLDRFFPKVDQITWTIFFQKKKKEKKKKKWVTGKRNRKKGNGKRRMEKGRERKGGGTSQN